MLFDLAARGEISHELIVDRACHAPADLFGVGERGYVREGWFADLVIVDPAKPYRVSPDNVLYKCGWSPFEGYPFRSEIVTTFVNGADVSTTSNVSVVPVSETLVPPEVSVTLKPAVSSSVVTTLTVWSASGSNASSDVLSCTARVMGIV